VEDELRIKIKVEHLEKN